LDEIEYHLKALLGGKMAKGEIVIDEAICKGCGYCAEFCARGCIEVPGDKFTPKGYLLPVFAHPEKCNVQICGGASLSPRSEDDSVLEYSTESERPSWGV